MFDLLKIFYSEVNVNITYFISYVTLNTMRQIYKDKSVNSLREIMLFVVMAVRNA